MTQWSSIKKSIYMKSVIVIFGNVWRTQSCDSKPLTYFNAQWAELTDFVESFSQVLQIFSRDLRDFVLHAGLLEALHTMQKGSCQTGSERVWALYIPFVHPYILVISKSSVDTTGKNTNAKNAVIGVAGTLTVLFKSLRLVRLYYFVNFIVIKRKMFD